MGEGAPGQVSRKQDDSRCRLKKTSLMKGENEDSLDIFDDNRIWGVLVVLVFG